MDKAKADAVLMGKLLLLKEETYLREEVEKMNTNLTTKVVALHKQMDKAKADAMAAFQILQPFFDDCDVFYGEGFDDCLKQVVAIYSDLDLSQIAIDDIVPPTPKGNNAVSNKTKDSVHIIEEIKYPDAEVIVQLAPEGPTALVFPSTVNGPTTGDNPISNAPLF
nr:hypothetical protein CFP56_58023 [Quercus suber]